MTPSILSALWQPPEPVYATGPLVAAAGSFSRIRGGGGYAGPYIAKTQDFSEPLLSWPGESHWHVGLETLACDMMRRPGPALRIPTLQLSTWRDLEVRGARGPELGLVGTPGADLAKMGWVNAVHVYQMRLLGCEGVMRFANASDLHFHGPGIECPWDESQRTPGVPRTTLLIEGPPRGEWYEYAHASVSDAHMENGVLRVRSLQKFTLRAGYYLSSLVTIEGDDVDVSDALSRGMWKGGSELYVNGERMHPRASWWRRTIGRIS